MKRLYLLALFLLMLAVCPVASAQNDRAYGFCTPGSENIQLQGLTQSYPPGVMGAHAGCTVTVYEAGTVTIATIYSDATGTPLANPFTADTTTGYWFFYAAPALHVDVQISDASIPTPFTYGDIIVGGGGGGGSCSGTASQVLYTPDGTTCTGTSFSFGTVGGITLMGSLPGSTGTYCDACGYFMSNTAGNQGVFLGIGLGGAGGGEASIAGISSATDGGFFIIQPSSTRGTFSGQQDKIGDAVFQAQRSSDASPIGYYLKFTEELNTNAFLFTVDVMGHVYDAFLDAGTQCLEAISGVITGTGTPCGSGGSGPAIETDGTPNTDQTVLNMVPSTTNAVGLTVTPVNPSGGIEQYEITGGSYTGNAATSTALASTPTTCPGGQAANGVLANGNPSSCVSVASGLTTQTNGVNNLNQTVLNIISAATFNGLTLAMTNTSGGVVQPGFIGTLNNAGLTNSSITINGQTVSLGASGTIPFQHNGSSNTSQAGINAINSTVNAVGLTATVSNPATNQMKIEITGGAYTGTATNLSGTPALPNGTSATTQLCSDTTTKLATDQFVNSCSIINPMTAIGQIIAGGALGVPTAVAAGITGQYLLAINGTTPTFQSPGVGGRTVSASTDSILCDSGTTLQDRGASELYTNAGGTTVTVPDPTGGCAGHFVTRVGAGPGSGTVTFNRTSTATFTVLTGSAATSGNTSFSLTVGQFATIQSPDNSIYIVWVD